MNKFFFLFFMLAFLAMPAYSLSYDYSSTKKLSIKLKIINEISTKMPIVEGEQVKFRVVDDVYYKNVLIVKKNTIVPARIEMIITRGMNGFPAEIIIDNFEIPNVRQSQLLGTYIKTGQNRSLLVYPIKWALTWLPGVGSFTNFIKGGHAYIKPKSAITLYYYPEWK